MSKDLSLITKLDSFASRLAVIQEVNELVLETGKIIEEIIEVEYSGMYLLDEESGALELVYSKGFNKEEQREAQRTAHERHPGWVFRNRQILNIADTELNQEGSSTDSVRRIKIRSRLWLPVVVDGKSIGAYGLSSAIPNRFNEEDVAALRFVINIVSVVMMNIRYRKQQEAVQENLKRSIEEISRAKELKEKFLANMSHELRTPMNGIIGMTEMLSETHLESDQRFFVDSIRLSSQNLLKLLNDILDFSKIEAGQLHMEHVPFSLRLLIDQVELLARIQTAEKLLEHHISIDPAIHDRLIGDPLRLSQVLMNLVSNAVKFTAKGSVNLEVKMLKDRTDCQDIAFIVKDTGIGIDGDKLDKVFESFKQEDDSITRKYGGTGLGLAISREIVGMMHGTIEIESEKGEGTQFTVTVCISKGEEEQQGITVLSSPPSDQAGTSGRSLDVLVVEDDKLSMYLLYTLLTKMGHRVQQAENGKVAVDLVSKEDFDLIFMDMQMPEMDGLTATRIIRNELHKTMPIIANTANAIKGDVDRCMEAGMTDYISKPYNLQELKLKVLELVK